MAEENLRDKRKGLAVLEAREGELRSLRDLENDLEVECIAAKAALGSASSRAPSTIDAATASAIGLALAHRRMLAEAMADLERRRAPRPGRPEEGRQHLQAGRDALSLWLAKPERGPPDGVRLAARILLLVVTIGSVVAAIKVHPAFLLLVVVVAGPVSFLMLRGQDNEWRRLGARRRYDSSGLPPMKIWDEAHVRARLGELESSLSAPAAAPTDAATPDSAGGAAGQEAEQEALAARLAEAETDVKNALRGVGLEAGKLDPELEGWLDLHARLERARLELEQVRSRRRAARGDAERIRDDLYRYLSRRGEAPADGHADTDSIAARIHRLDSRAQDTDD